MQNDWQQVFESILSFIPAEIASDLTLLGTFLVAACAIAARFWPRPASGSKWLGLYALVNRIAMNSKHAANADDTQGPGVRRESGSLPAYTDENGP